MRGCESYERALQSRDARRSFRPLTELANRNIGVGSGRTTPVRDLGWLEVHADYRSPVSIRWRVRSVRVLRASEICGMSLVGF